MLVAVEAEAAKFHRRGKLFHQALMLQLLEAAVQALL
jgi:hypothetical protein